MVRQLTSAELKADSDHGKLATRVEDVKVTKEAFASRLSSLLVVRENHGSNLEGTVMARAEIVSVLRRPHNASDTNDDNDSMVIDNTPDMKGKINRSTGGSDDDANVDNNVRKEKNRIEQGNKDIDLKEGTLENGYDHSNCHDCSCVPELTLDCVQHLIKLSTQSMQMTQRLQSIVELREQIKDLWGNQIGPNGSFQITA